MKSLFRPFATLIAVVAISGTACEREYRTISCESHPTNPCEEDTSEVNIRVINETTYRICNVTVGYRTDSIIQFNYGTMEPGEYSCYMHMNKSMVFPRVEFNYGELHFTTEDTLLSDSLGWTRTFLKDPGNYSLRVFTAGELHLAKVQAYLSRD